MKLKTTVTLALLSVIIMSMLPGNRIIITTGTRRSFIDVDRYQEIFRDMISEHMINENSGYHMVGGPGCIVEVDVAQYGSCFCYQTQRLSSKLIFTSLLGSNVFIKKVNETTIAG